MRSRTLIYWLSLPTGLLLAEGAVRIAGLRPYPVTQVIGAVYGPSEETRLGYENTPGGVQHLIYRDRAGAILEDVESRVNAQGFRGPVVPESKPDGHFRIACIGDSHTFGYGVGEGESWPAVLESELRALPGGDRYEVMNCAVNAYEAEQSLAYLELRVERYRPDLVLFGFFLNDTAIRKLPGPKEQEQPTWIMRMSDPRQGGVVRWLRDHSRAVDLFAGTIFEREALTYWARAHQTLFADDFEGWIRVRAALERARDRTAAEGIRFLVLLIPLLVEVDGELMSTKPLERVREFCARSSIECEDLAPAFRGKDLGELRMHPLDFHANPAAHRVLGVEVARLLTATGRLPAPVANR